ncbi:conserved hypothetical protein [Chloroherpeton thalassium ATCC 35110]|uniref:Predicted 3'-5' exonuclease PolB-like domain-containing protein n=1 Tax=Chloroherpeton thalassium (strain ATCC 35110 / GB-78) TaxID=517418 RepID=B3QUR4_CHLT3|nr:3'-5' exonuclease [Chloroherpeton thalassium]ACF12970.1 conserved hypothetical protein [Chloroherpeton thalassium ATCC 35110]
MFTRIEPIIWFFDAEWIPNPAAGSMLYDLPDSLSEKEIFDEMWKAGGATPEKPMPYLKTVLCRVVSIAAVIRKNENGGVALSLRSRPKNPDDALECEEKAVLQAFFDGVEKHDPQLVGFNSRDSDLKILTQRALAHGIQAPKFFQRPDRPWDERNIDLMEHLSGRTQAKPSLHELATMTGIPGKIDADGEHIAALWLEGKLEKIVAYNECDALTTYLLWLRSVFVSGRISAEAYRAEEDLLRALLESEIQREGKSHLEKYLQKWEALQS